MSADAPKFTLRFRNRRTHELLGLVAERRGVSKNRLAEEMLERELSAAALLIERRCGDSLQSERDLGDSLQSERHLGDSLRRLRRYRGEELLDQDIADFAAGEASGSDPLRARMIRPEELGDSFGVLSAFDDRSGSPGTNAS